MYQPTFPSCLSSHLPIFFRQHSGISQITARSDAMQKLASSPPSKSSHNLHGVNNSQSALNQATPDGSRQSPYLSASYNTDTSAREFKNTSTSHSSSSSSSSNRSDYKVEMGVEIEEVPSSRRMSYPPSPLSPRVNRTSSQEQARPANSQSSDDALLEILNHPDFCSCSGFVVDQRSTERAPSPPAMVEDTPAPTQAPTHSSFSWRSAFCWPQETASSEEEPLIHSSSRQSSRSSLDPADPVDENVNNRPNLNQDELMHIYRYRGRYYLGQRRAFKISFSALGASEFEQLESIGYFKNSDQGDILHAYEYISVVTTGNPLCNNMIDTVILGSTIFDLLTTSSETTTINHIMLGVTLTVYPLIKLLARFLDYRYLFKSRHENMTLIFEALQEVSSGALAYLNSYISTRLTYWIIDISQSFTYWIAMNPSFGPMLLSTIASFIICFISQSFTPVLK